MSSDTVTPYRSELRVGGDGFAHVLHAEWTKFRTVRGWLISLGVAALLTVLVGSIGPLGTSIACGGPSGCRHRTPTLGPDGEPVQDMFYFVHQTLDGDGSITVRMASLTGLYPDLGPTAASSAQGPTAQLSGVQPWSKAGIMIKQNTSIGSSYAAVMVTGSNGVRMQYDYTHDVAGLPGAVTSTSPRWLRLTRAGRVVTGYDSTDGVHWTAIGTATLPHLGTVVQAGLFVASPEYSVSTQFFGGSSGVGGSTVATASFDGLKLLGTWPQDAWKGDPIGGDGQNDGTNPGYQHTGDTFTVTGTGDIAPTVPGQGSMEKTIADSLVGLFAGLIAVIVVAAMFVTAEYRRGLIRLTLAAAPQRGRLLAAKAIVIGAAGFVTGLVAAVTAIQVVGKLEQDKGLYVYPVAASTEVRVVVGTALLVAVAAVLALGVGTILRRSAGAVAVVVVAIVLPYILSVASILPASATEWLTRLTPAAAFAIEQTSPQYVQVPSTYTPADGYFPLAPWAGLGVLCLYAAVAMGLATVLIRRRDA
jgi:ABC-type transport system involved in multi-copper enzyme maturation permease subunit